MSLSLMRISHSPMSLGAYKSRCRSQTLSEQASFCVNRHHRKQNRQQSNTALHRTPPLPCPVLGRSAVLAVSPVSAPVRPLAPLGRGFRGDFSRQLSQGGRVMVVAGAPAVSVVVGLCVRVSCRRAFGLTGRCTGRPLSFSSARSGCCAGRCRR